MPTWPLWIAVSRWADGVSLKMTLSSSKPSSLATYLATSTSKPVKSSPSFWPRPGWSNLMPIVRLSPGVLPALPPPPHDSHGGGERRSGRDGENLLADVHCSPSCRQLCARSRSGS